MNDDASMPCETVLAQLRAMDGLVHRLCACGFPVGDAIRAYAYLFQVVLASIGSGDAPVTEMHRELMNELGAMSHDGEFETLREGRGGGGEDHPEAQFEYDFDCTLRGIAARSGIRRGALPDGAGRRRRPQTAA